MSSRTYRSSVYGAPPAAEPRPVRPREPGSPRRTGPVRGGRRRDPLWAKLCVIFGALLMMGSGGVIVGGKVLIDQAVSGVNQRNLLGGAGITDGKAANIDGAINILMVGLDARAKQDPDEPVRSDTIVILHIPASHDQAYLVSLPRDARVRIPDYPKTGFRGYSTKINAAFAGGYQGGGTEDEKRDRGVELLAMTIRDLAGIQFNAASIIDFVGFEAVLRELGGVDMCVEHRAESIHLAYDKTGKIIGVWYDDAAGKVRGIPPGGRPLVHEKGCRHMTAQLALDYSRIRKNLPGGDYDRQRNQQKLLKAIAKAATDKGMIRDPGRLMRVAQAAGKAFTLDTQGVPIEHFVFTLKSVAANDMVMVKTNAGKANTIPGTSDEQLTEDSMRMLAAVRDGTLLQFLAAHPEFVASS